MITDCKMMKPFCPYEEKETIMIIQGLRRRALPPPIFLQIKATHHLVPWEFFNLELEAWTPHFFGLVGGP